MVQDRTVQRWGHDERMCPHCTLHPDEVIHRFWVCPELSRARSAALGGLTLHEVWAETPDLTRRTGLIPVSYRMKLDKHLAESEPIPAGNPVAGLPETVYTDGAASDPEDPWLRRASWAVAWRLPGGGWGHRSGPTPGRQTVARSELCAAYWASVSAGPGLLIVTDSRYVFDGLAALRSGRARKYLDGLDGDLWSRFLGRRIPEARWVPSHKPIEVFLARGFYESDWYGNKAADRFAGLALVGREVHPRVRDAQRRRLRVLASAVRVVAEVQLAHLKVRHARGSEVLAVRGPRQLPRPAAPVGGFFRRELGRPELMSTAPPGCHDLAACDGPIPEGLTRRLLAGERGRCPEKL